MTSLVIQSPPQTENVVARRRGGLLGAIISNRKALVAGAAHRDIRVHLTPTRDKAVEWVRATLTDGDVVLYENDLPDHYP